MKLFLILFFLPFSAFGLEKPAFSGKWLGDIYYPTLKSDESKPLTQLSTHLFLQADESFSEKFSARIIYQGNGFDAQNSRLSGSGSSTHWENELREGYAYFSKPGLEIKAGKQIIPWGKSDGINPTDFLTAKDMTYFNQDEEVKRKGGAGVQIQLTPNEGTSSWTFTGVWFPYFAKGKVYIPPSTLPASVRVSDETNSIPENFQNSETALKVAYVGSGWDFSLSAFNGWKHQPELVEKNRTLTTTLVGTTPVINYDLELATYYRRVSAVGGDASYVFGKHIFRFETAYIRTENDNGQNALIQPSNWSGVLGVERPLVENWRTQIQFFWIYYPQYTPPEEMGGLNAVDQAINRQVASGNALLHNYKTRSKTSVTWRLTGNNSESTFEKELFVIYNFADQDSLIRPKLTYSWTDTLKTALGADIFNGRAGQTFGSILSRSSIWVEAKYIF